VTQDLSRLGGEREYSSAALAYRDFGCVRHAMALGKASMTDVPRWVADRECAFAHSADQP
jgi:hypothetical protein